MVLIVVFVQMHDTDGNDKLDGCELVKSLIHWHGEKRELNQFVLIFESLWDFHSPASSSLWMSSVTLLRALPSNHPSPDILVAWSQLWDFLILLSFKAAFRIHCIWPDPDPGPL